MPRLGYGHRLARLSRPLEPSQAPYYVAIENASPGPHPAPGWYWTPKGARTPSYLAATAARAEVVLVDLARERRARAAA